MDLPRLCGRSIKTRTSIFLTLCGFVVGCGSTVERSREREHDDSAPATAEDVEEVFDEAVGTLPGRITVNNFGAAQYAIDISVPPGTGAVQPALKLRYDSRSNRNGVLGVGWSLGGLSAILRTPSSIRHDGVIDPVDFDQKDRLSIDGQRLRRVLRGYWKKSSVYKTEVDSFARIFMHDGYFVSKTKSGLLMRYGYTEDAKFSLSGKGTVLWQLDRVSDRFGNFMDVEYESSEDASEQYVARIKYTGHETENVEPDRFVEFVYESRPDQVLKFGAGARTALRKRLSAIVVRVGKEVVREYRMTYQQSRISNASQLIAVREVTGETGKDGNLIALRPTKFFWRNGPKSLTDKVSSTDVPLAGVSESVPHRVHVTGDFDGDGRTDILIGTAGTSGRVLPGTTTLTAYLSTKKETAEVVDLGPACAAGGQKKVLATGDFNADGLTDFVVSCVGSAKETADNPDGGASAGAWHVYAARPGGSFERIRALRTPVVRPPFHTCGQIRGSGDFNGDGATDILLSKCVMLARPNVFRPNQGKWVFSTVVSTKQNEYFRATDRVADEDYLRLLGFFVGDVNGDGVSDLFFELAKDLNLKHPKDETYQAELVTLVGQGNGTFVEAEPTPLGLRKYARVQTTGDFNGDGLTDLLLAEQGKDFFARQDRISGKPSILFSSGDGRFVEFSTNISITGFRSVSQVVAAGDFDGDGNTDVVLSKRQERRADAHRTLWRFRTMSDTHASFSDVRLSPKGGGAWAATTGDFRGDGRTEILSVKGDGQGRMVAGNARTFGLAESSIDRITGVENGMGAITKIQYQRITNPQRENESPIYVKGGGAEYPVADVQSPMVVVSKVSEDTGFGKPNRFNDVLYHYAHARIDRVGRGFLGFQIFESYDLLRNLSVHETLSQAFPHLGMTLEKNSCAHDGPEDTRGQRLKRVSNVLGAVGTTTREVTQGEWTRWLDRDDPSHTGDFESIAHHIEDGTLPCDNPTGIECLTVYGTTLKRAGENVICDLKTGLVCRDEDQEDGRCHRDYMVRYLCEQKVDQVVTTFPFVESSKEDTWELGSGALCASSEGSGSDPAPHDTVRTTNDFDEFGNNLQVLSIWDEGQNQEQRYQVDNEFSKLPTWRHLGRLAKTTITVSGRHIEEASRTTLYQYTKEGATASEHVASSPSLTTQYEYDAFGNVTLTTQSGDGIETRQDTRYFDKRGLFERCRRNSLGHLEYREYDARSGQVTRLIGANEMARRNLAHRCPVRVTDLAHSIRYAYDAFGNLVSQEHPDGRRVSTVRSFVQNQEVLNAFFEERVEQSGRPTKIELYDRLGRTLRTFSVRGLSDITGVATRYNVYGHPYQQSAPYLVLQKDRVLWRNSEYDQLGRVTRVTEPNGKVVETKYDGRVTTMRTIPTEENAPVQVSTSIVDSRGRVVQTIDDHGNSVHFRYDGFGNPIKTTAHIDGRLKEATVVAYDARGNRTSIDDPNLGFWQYEYNAAGEMTSVTNANGEVNTMDYDSLGRLTRRVAPEGESTWEYDRKKGIKGGFVGRLVFQKGAGSVDQGRIRAYDVLGRLQSTAQTIDGVRVRKRIEYDAYGRLEAEHYDVGSGRQLVPTFSLRRTRNLAGYLVQLKDQDDHVWFDARTSPSNANAPLGYDAQDRPTRYRLGASVDNGDEGISVINLYHRSSKLLESVTAKSLWTENFGTVQADKYVYDSLGNLVQRNKRLSRDIRSESFEYDTLNRLTTSRIGQAEVTVRYDGSGNIEHKSDVGSYAYGQEDSRGIRRFPHAVTEARGQSFRYDDSGQMISRGEDSIFWTSFGKPEWVGTERISTAFEYDASERRIRSIVDERLDDLAPTEAGKKWSYRSTTKTYFEPEFEVIKQTDGTCELGEEKSCEESSSVQKIRVLVRGPDGILGVFETSGTAGSGDRKYFLKDHLGSIAKVLDSQGSTVARYSYDAWGRRRDPRTGDAFDKMPSVSDLVTDRGFTSHEMLDAHTLVHMNGRIYDPTLGRFLSGDPIIDRELDLQNHNRYAYVLNRPLNLIDPSGYTGVGAAIGFFVAVVVEAIQVLAAVASFVVPLYQFGDTVATTGDWGAAFVNLAISWGTALVTYGIGRGFDAVYTQSTNAVAVELARATTHGVWQGAYNEVTGQGSFTTGAIAGVSASLVGHLGLKKLPPAIKDNKMISTMLVGAASGTAAEIGGGKFMNGFRIGTTVHRYNAEGESPWRKAGKQAEGFGQGKAAEAVGGYVGERMGGSVARWVLAKVGGLATEAIKRAEDFFNAKATEAADAGRVSYFEGPDKNSPFLVIKGPSPGATVPDFDASLVDFQDALFDVQTKPWYQSVWSASLERKVLFWTLADPSLQQ